ncbi:MAG: 50S ribosomal protein L18 [Deltaproteobacteria bacterium]|nr:50S ribosomal protein L18 [Deltaproteobacteria bacterium]RKX60871.1 MAG: 50S ribosomal protein L18 [Thermodesulfobacteriota bacterium]MBW1966242.1 50S ribosomal protein L18 [Deltaproteobacteria bacterium]MBW2097211.1 50S ribosomal protein L18 [Deltaproteobacteria bacterium]PXF53233.1 MAG: 50S ribosomal protein L18 [Deltaproteobacteria bacterium]
MAKTSPKLKARLRRKQHIRKRISGTGNRPRMAIFRSSKHIYAQIIDDERGITIASASSLTPEIRNKAGDLGDKTAVAKEVGRIVAQRAKGKGINAVAFDRGGYLYHGRVKALAEAAREAGLDF